MYNVNAGVPKTLVRQLVAWVADHQSQPTERDVLRRGPRHPGLPGARAPGRTGGNPRSSTEDIVGPYELHDFFLYCLAAPGGGAAEDPLPGRAGLRRRATTAPRSRGWLRVFLDRFFDNQFKRSVMPDGPKVGSVSLSPRGDWRMPSDASKAAWLRELDGA